MEFKKISEVKEIKNNEEKLPSDFDYRKQYISEPTEEDYNKLVHRDDIFSNNDYSYNEYEEESKKLR